MIADAARQQFRMKTEHRRSSAILNSFPRLFCVLSQVLSKIQAPFTRKINARTKMATATVLMDGSQSHDPDIAFMEIVRNYPAIYDRSSKDFKDVRFPHLKDFSDPYPLLPILFLFQKLSPLSQKRGNQQKFCSQQKSLVYSCNHVEFRAITQAEL